jgi:UDP-N-acetylglucosamine acyltransferase
MMSGMTGSRLDLPPFTTSDGRPAMVRGVNAVGLRRQGVSQKVRSTIKEAYRLLYRSGKNVSQSLTCIQEQLEPYPEIKEIIEFFASTKRGVAGVITADAEIVDELPSEVI